MKTLYPTLKITDPSFNYVPSSKTDIRETFRRFSTEYLPQNQESKEPLVLEITLNPDGFVLSADWME